MCIIETSSGLPRKSSAIFRHLQKIFGNSRKIFGNLRLARTISPEWGQRRSRILFLAREHKIHIFELTSNVLFIIYTYWRRCFLLFSEDFRPLYEDLRRFSKIFPKARRTFPNIIREFSKSSEDAEDFRRLPKPFEEDPKMFRWYINEFKTKLREKLDISEIIDIFTCEDIVSFLSICYHSVYHWLLYNKLFLPLGHKINIFSPPCKILAKKGQTFWNPRKDCTKRRQLSAVVSVLCVCPLNADKLRRKIVKVSVDPRGFVERENERQTEIKNK